MPEEIGGKNVFKAFQAGHHAGNISAVIVEISGKEKVGAGNEVALQELHKCAIHQPSFAVFFLWPGVRRVYVDCRERTFRDSFCDELAGFFPEYANVFQVLDIDSAASLVAALVVKVDGNEVCFRAFCCGEGDEVADPAADFQGYGMIIAENCLPVGRFFQVFRSKIVG